MLTVSMGVAFDIERGATPTTGYVWELPAPPAAVRALGSDFKVSPGAPVGSGGTQVFHLQADQAGRFALEFQLKRRWESTPISTQVVEVEVR